MWDRSKKVNIVNKHIFNKSYHMKLKFEMSSTCLSQCVANCIDSSPWNHSIIILKTVHNEEVDNQKYIAQEIQGCALRVRKLRKTEKTELFYSWKGYKSNPHWTFGALINKT